MARKHSTRKHKKHTQRRKTYRKRGGRGYTTGAAAELAQMAPAPIGRLIGAGLAFMNGGWGKRK